MHRTYPISNAMLRKLENASHGSTIIFNQITVSFNHRLTTYETLNLSRLFKSASRKPDESFTDVLRLAFAEALYKTAKLLRHPAELLGRPYGIDVPQDGNFKRYERHSMTDHNAVAARHDDSARLAFTVALELAGDTNESIGLTAREIKILELNEPSRIFLLKSVKYPPVTRSGDKLTHTPS